MELNTILELVRAGYTKDEISQMDIQTPAVPDAVPVPAPVETPEPTTEPVAAPVTEPVAVPAPAPQPQPAQDQPSMADVMQSIAKLTSAIQANAIAQSVIPSGLQNPQRAEDMLAEIIRPTFKERS